MPHRYGLLVLALLAVVGRSDAQGLQIREAVTLDALGDTTAMRRTAVATAPETPVWVGRTLLDLTPGSIETVGLEVGPDGATLSLWLSDAAGRAVADLTARSVGHALALVYRDRVLTAPVVESEIPNGLVLITGLDIGEGRQLAEALRTASDGPAGAPGGEIAERPLLPERPPRAAVPGGIERSPGATREAGTWEAGTPETVATAWATAVGQRDWAAAAALLHPDATRAVRPDALALLRLDGPLVRVRDGQTEGSFPAVRALGRPPSASRADALSGEDLAVLYLAALDVLGAWGDAGPPRAVAGVIADGARTHVLLRAGGGAQGLSDVSVVTVARDDAGRWRVLLTQARGF